MFGRSVSGFAYVSNFSLDFEFHGSFSEAGGAESDIVGWDGGCELELLLGWGVKSFVSEEVRQLRDA